MSKTSYFPAATPWQRMGTLSTSTTALPIQALLWRTAAFALSCAGWTPTVIRNIAATGVTNDPLAGDGRKFSLHSKLVFTQGGWSARDDPKKIGAKTQRLVQVMRPLQMTPGEFSGALRCTIFLKTDGPTGMREIPAGWQLLTTDSTPARIRCGVSSSAKR